MIAHPGKNQMSVSFHRISVALLNFEHAAFEICKWDPFAYREAVVA